MSKILNYSLQLLPGHKLGCYCLEGIGWFLESAFYSFILMLGSLHCNKHASLFLFTVNMNWILHVKVLKHWRNLDMQLESETVRIPVSSWSQNNSKSTMLVMWYLEKPGETTVSSYRLYAQYLCVHNNKSAIDVKQTRLHHVGWQKLTEMENSCILRFPWFENGTR